MVATDDVDEGMTRDPGAPPAEGLREALESLQDARGQLRDKEAELDVAYQEIFESSRHTSALAARLQRTLDELQAVQSQRRQLADQLQAVLATKSWRVTRPLRWIDGLFRR